MKLIENYDWNIYLEGIYSIVNNIVRNNNLTQFYSSDTRNGNYLAQEFSPFLPAEAYDIEEETNQNQLNPLLKYNLNNFKSFIEEDLLPILEELVSDNAFNYTHYQIEAVNNVLHSINTTLKDIEIEQNIENDIELD